MFTTPIDPANPDATGKIGSEVVHYQIFLFRISNTPPEVTLYKTDTQTNENVIKNNT